MKALIEHLGFVPETCVWELTRTCNLRCSHCGTSAGKPRPGELTTDEAVDVARQLARLGNRLTTLSGGEPTLRKDWPEIAWALVEAGVTVNMVTNGQCDGSELAALAKGAGLANVAVSVDGLEETHDVLRGPGAFARATGAIRQLVAAGIWVDVMFTVNRANLHQLVDVWELTQRLDARRFRVQLGKPMGNQTHRDDLTLQPTELLSLIPLLGRLANAKGPEVRIGDSIGYFSRDERALRGRYCDQGHWTGCYAGVRAIGIQADGGVKGCLSLQPRANEVDPFIEGNLHEESLEAIWQRPTAFAYNRQFTLGNLKGACAKCSHASLCRGGATCVAYSYLGEVGCDPMCYYHAAGLSADTPQRVWPVSASAAATAILVSLGACGGESANGSNGGQGGSMAGTGTSGLGGMPSQGGTFGSSGASRATGGVAMMPDYGIIQPTGGTGSASIGLDYGVFPPTGGTGSASIGLDYGVFAPTGGTPGKGGASATGSALTKGGASGSGGTAAAAGSANVSGSGQAGKSTVGGSSSANTGGSAGAAANECANVCCNCEYGIMEPTLFKACCCKSVCCDCDYGVAARPAACCAS